MFKSIEAWLKKLIEQWGIPADYLEVSYVVFVSAMLLAAVFLCHLFFKKIALAYLKKIIRDSNNQFDDLLLDSKIFHRFVYFFPLLLLHYFWPQLLISYPAFSLAIAKIVKISLVITGMMCVFAVTDALHGLYNKLPSSKGRSIKGYVQVLKIILYTITAILCLSVLLDQSPLYFLGGMSALAAILLLVFKDTILGLVAGIQLAANNMVKIGDHIEVPSKNADGTVIDLTLNTVKVENGDKTIAHFPTYVLVSESFINWRGMAESGGRRIKRSILIDVGSIKFCTAAMLAKFKKISILKQYIVDKEQELKEDNRKKKLDSNNGRRQTNIGVFRAYLKAYLRQHPKINQKMTFLVRQLQQTERSLPLEIYIFCIEKTFAEYEAVQADIFDHIFAVIGEFELRMAKIS